MRLINIFLVCFLVLCACTDTNQSNEIIDSTSYKEQKTKIQVRPLPNPNKNAYFGDLHVHTSNSFDAYTFGTIASPSDAYRFAQGEAIPHPTGYEIQLKKPLDFYAVTDHAFFMGIIKEAADTLSLIHI